MNTLTTRKIVLGALMTLVLAFSVQGIADALTFNTSRTGDLQTVFANQEIKLTFSVRLQANTHILHTNGKRITQPWATGDGAPSAGLTAATGTQYYVDSSGYVLNDEDGQRVNEAGTAIDTSGYQLNSDGNRVNNAAGTHAIDSSGFQLNADGTRVTNQGSSATYYTLIDSTGSPQSVDSSRYEVDTTTGLRLPANNRIAGATQFKPADTDQVKVPDEFRYHYSSEGIMVDIEDSTGASDGPANIIRVGSHTVPTSAAKTLMMYESTHPSYNTAAAYEKLSGSVSLTLAPTGPGVIEIIVSDDTPADDAPTNGRSQPITFTVYVVDYSLSVSTSALSFDDLREENYAYVNDQYDPQIVFTVTSNPASNAPVNVKIAEGPGRLYVRKTYTGGTPTNGSPASQGSAGKELDVSAQVATGGDTGANVYLDVGGGTNRITIRAPGIDPVTAIYVFGRPSIEIVSGNPQTGATNGRLEDALVVKVKDEKNRGVPMAIVTFASGNTTDADERFLPVPGTSVHVDDETPVPDWASSFADIDDINMPVVATSLHPMTADSNPLDVDDDVIVQTDRNGEAQVYFQLGGTVGPQNITVSSVGESARFTVTAIDPGRSASLVLVSGDNQRSDATTHDVENPLVVRVRRPGGYRISGVRIRFTALTGVLSPGPGRSAVLGPGASTITTSGQEIFVDTDAHGEASVIYNAGQIAGAKTVTARVDDEEATTQYDFQIRQVEFHIDGTGSPPSRDTPDDTPDDTTFTPLTLLVSETSITGQPGSTHDITITASETAQVGNPVLGEFLNAGGSASPSSGTGTFASTLTLPSTEGTYDLIVNMGTERRTVTVTVSSTATEQPQTGGGIALDIPISGAVNSSHTVRVTVIDADGNQVSNVAVTLSITSGGGTLSPSRVTTNNAGVATSQLTLGSTAGNNYFVTATATGYPPVEKRISITGTSQQQEQPTPREAGEPDSIDVYDGDGQRGVPNARLAEPLVVEVVDANNNPVANERVTFRTTRGSGRFSPSRPRTDQSGRAQTRFTPISSGDIRIAASVAGVASRAVFTITAGEAPASLTKVSGDNQSGTPGNALSDPFAVEVKDEDGDGIEGIRVTFSVTAGGGSLSETSATTDEDGRAETTLTLGSQPGVNSVEASVPGVDPVTFNTSVKAEILVAAANRPVMYWIANGALYRLAGAKEAKIAESVNRVAVGGGKLYWTETTGETSGTINSANLDGSDAAVLASIRSVPIGIAVDTAGSKLYWTNARGRIQSANLNGSGIKTVLQNLSNPMDIVVANGFIYWTEDGDTIRRVNMTGRKTPADVATNLDTVGGLAVGGEKVYWTEATSASAGTVNGADLNGTNFETLATIRAAPMGISVDVAGSQLYWTNSRGRIQRANLNGSGIKTVVKGLISPSQLLTGGANVAEAVPKQPAQPTKKDTSAYDVNGDGSVDNVDAGLVIGSLGTTTAKYDIDGDGSVTFTDVQLILNNRDEGAAGAPMMVGMKLSAVQIDRIQEQIDLLIATGDRSPAAMRTLIYLQQLIATARPEKTQLFANYPNPFNPETWIPYELATDTNVKITIYNTQGVVIRTLELGHQSAGYYTGRDRAAYWDGRNAFGEQVASGIYFYQFETDDMSSMRKMVILK